MSEVNDQQNKWGVLRPSLLGTAPATSSVGQTADNGANDSPNKMATNPFMKEQNDTEEGDNNAGDGEDAKSTNASESKKLDEDVDEKSDPLNLLRKNGLERANLFAAAKNAIPRVEKSGFVFGQNVHERVLCESTTPESNNKSESKDTSASTSNELLFSSVIQNAVKASGEQEEVATKENEAKTLNDVAREYEEESRAQKRKYEEVETFTGEENEINITDINCKLFAFVNSNWEERGRGSLRLNDSKIEQECSRVVFRTSGNLRLLLNTKVWAGMVADRSSAKSLRLTAMDNTGKIKIFLAMARPADISQLHSALVKRIDARKVSHPEEGHAPNEESNGDLAKNSSEVVSTSHSEQAGTSHSNDIVQVSETILKLEEPVQAQADTEDNDKAGPSSPKKILNDVMD